MAKSDTINKESGAMAPASSHPNLPVVNADEVSEALDPRSNPPRDEDHSKGIFKRISDGELYALAIHKPDCYNRTHSLKNSLHFWQGNESEFRIQFDKA